MNRTIRPSDNETHMNPVEHARLSRVGEGTTDGIWLMASSQWQKTDCCWLDGSMVNHITMQLSNYATTLCVSTTRPLDNDVLAHYLPRVDTNFILNIIENEKV